MKAQWPVTFPGFILILSAAAVVAPKALAASYAITATNVTMPAVTVVTSSGGVTSISLGSSQFTVTGIPGAGTLFISCQYSGPATQARIPQACGPVGPGSFPVPANQTTFTGTVYFVPYGNTIPSLGQLHSAPAPFAPLPVSGMVLAGTLTLGFGFRRRTHRWLAQVAVVIGALAVLAGLSACGGSSNRMTPGAYQYTISSSYTPGQTTVAELSTANITLTIQ